MADNIQVKDAAGTSRILKTTEEGGTLIHTPHHIVLSSALPAGAATSANQTTAIGHVDGIETLITAGNVDLAAMEVLLTAGNVDLAAIETLITATNVDLAAIEILLTAANVDHAAIEALLTTIDADTNDIKTAVEIIDNAISGSEMQVDVVAALPAGDNNIGNVDIVTLPALVASSANIGDVDVVSVTLPTTVYHGKKVVTAGTDEVIAGSQVLKSGVTVKALAGNAGIVYVGVENVAAATGFELSAKESVFIECDNTNRIWLDAATGSADGITYIGS